LGSQLQSATPKLKQSLSGLFFARHDSRTVSLFLDFMKMNMWKIPFVVVIHVLLCIADIIVPGVHVAAVTIAGKKGKPSNRWCFASKNPNSINGPKDAYILKVLNVEFEKVGDVVKRNIDRVIKKATCSIGQGATVFGGKNSNIFGGKPFFLHEFVVTGEAENFKCFLVRNVTPLTENTDLEVVVELP